MFRRRNWFVRLSYLWAELEQDRRHHPLLCGSSATCPHHENTLIAHSQKSRFRG